MIKPPTKRYKKILLTAAAILVSIFIILLIFVNRFIEPILRDRLHTLIIQGSDSLYTYSLGNLNANFFGGNVEIENVQINIDSNRYEYLRQKNALPALTMQLSLKKGSIKGIDIFSLLFEKKIEIEEIFSKDANIKLSRHAKVDPGKTSPHISLWKAIEQKIKGIAIGRIKLEGIKMNYKNADTSESVKLEFEGCDADFNNIRIDSAAAFDTSRIGFTKSISLNFQEVKYRTPDSVYKLKADTVKYSSVEKTLEIEYFKFQPTLKKDEFYKIRSMQEPMYVLKFKKVKFTNFHLDHFIRNNVIDADNVIFDSTNTVIYTDHSLSPNLESRIGKYPQQQLLNSSAIVNIKNIILKNAQVTSTEKDNVTLQEGTFTLSNMNINISNITNDPGLIKKNPVCFVKMNGAILGSSPITALFKFYLDSSNGKFEASGSAKNITAAQLNSLAVPLANVQINSLNIKSLSFYINGKDYEATGNVKMLYNDLSITLKKTNEETGESSTKKFLTKVVSKFVIWSDNPNTDGIERTSQNRTTPRLTTQSFFGFLWKAIFAGMQDIMMKAGRYG